MPGPRQLTLSESYRGDRVKVATDSGHPSRTSETELIQVPIPEGLKLPRKHVWQCKSGLAEEEEPG